MYLCWLHCFPFLLRDEQGSLLLPFALQHNKIYKLWQATLPSCSDSEPDPRL